jgi:CheY-like chemotaxis protein
VGEAGPYDRRTLGLSIPMSAEQTQTAGRRILIVDDEASIRLICRINLTASGWACEEADNGEEAVVRIRADRPDVVLLDVMMPIRDGWMVAEDIAGDPALRDVPIIFLSARAEKRDRERAHSLGAVGYLTKPLNPVGLSAAIEEILGRIAKGEREQLRAELLSG